MGDQTKLEPNPPPKEPTPISQSTSVSDPPADITQNPSNSSKIPTRPHKTRKLASTTSAAAAADADTTEPKPTTATDGDAKAVVVYDSTTTTATTSKNRRRKSSQTARVPPRPIKALSSDGEIDLALRHLRSADPLLSNLIDSLPPPAFESHNPPFLALTRCILYQQLANKAGTSLYTRFVELCGGDNAVNPDTVLSLSTQQLRQIGISGRKAIYLYDLANKYKTGILSDSSIVGMDDRSLFTMLTMVKGIGSWSVHMFMIFSLHRPDVLPVGDLGIQKGLQFLYGLEELPRPSQMEQLCEKWRPYRSVGSWYMWRFVERKGAPQGGTVAALGGSNTIPLQQQMEQQQQTQQQHQLQLLEPINAIANLGACIWGQ